MDHHYFGMITIIEKSFPPKICLSLEYIVSELNEYIYMYLKIYQN